MLRIKFHYHRWAAGLFFTYARQTFATVEEARTRLRELKARHGEKLFEWKITQGGVA